ncbi:MAG: hypothetical protein AAB654_13885, partial [Acidobacteriota bacterium]
MHCNLAAATIAAIVLVTLLIVPGAGSAQSANLNRELAKMRELRAGDKVLDASDYTDRDAFRQALEAAELAKVDQLLREADAWYLPMQKELQSRLAVQAIDSATAAISSFKK